MSPKVACFVHRGSKGTVAREEQRRRRSRYSWGISPLLESISDVNVDNSSDRPLTPESSPK